MGKLLTEDESYLKLLIYGKSGTGKTSLGVTAPRPLILLSERQGFRSVRDAARRLGIPTPPTIWLESAADIRACLIALRGGTTDPIATAMRAVMENGPELEQQIAELPYTKPDTIVCDSMTDFFRLLSEDVIEGLGFPKARDGQEVRSDRYWDLMRSRSDRLVILLRDVPYHVLMLCLLDDRMVGKEEDEKTRVIGPDTPMRALASRLIQATNACGIAFQKQTSKMNEGSEPEFTYDWRVRFRGPTYMALKPCDVLKDIEEPDVTSWVMRILAHDATLSATELQERATNAAARTESTAEEVPLEPPVDETTHKPKPAGPRRAASTATAPRSE